MFYVSNIKSHSSYSVSSHSSFIGKCRAQHRNQQRSLSIHRINGHPSIEPFSRHVINYSMLLISNSQTSLLPRIVDTTLSCPPFSPLYRSFFYWYDSFPDPIKYPPRHHLRRVIHKPVENFCAQRGDSRADKEADAVSGDVGKVPRIGKEEEEVNANGVNYQCL